MAMPSVAGQVMPTATAPAAIAGDVDIETVVSAGTVAHTIANRGSSGALDRSCVDAAAVAIRSGNEQRRPGVIAIRFSVAQPARQRGPVVDAARPGRCPSAGDGPAGRADYRCRRRLRAGAVASHRSRNSAELYGCRRAAKIVGLGRDEVIVGPDGTVGARF